LTSYYRPGGCDPQPIADNLNASPSQVSLLFTSYMAVMGAAMLITGVVSSRIGPKHTLRIEERRRSSHC
jgi:MFS family permease